MNVVKPPLRRRGSVLLIVLVTLVFATSVLLLFIDKAGTDLIVEIREADAARLRLEAYSALETSLAVLEDFREACEGLHSPAEGWTNPLEFAGYEPQAGNTVDVAVEDESGKLPLPSVKAEVLVALFKYWGLSQTDAERVSDSYLGWTQKDYTPTAIGAPTTQDYEAAPLPFLPPGRSLRSFTELAAIEGVREVFFDAETGLPNELYRKFTSTFSLYRYDTPNFNGNRLEPLVAQEILDVQQVARVQDYIGGVGAYLTQGPGLFRNGRAVAAVAGIEPTRLGYGYEVKALRITVTVRRELASFRLSVVVAPSGGAQVVVSSAATTADGTNSTEANSMSTSAASSTPATAVPEAVDLKYPFTFLEIRENDGGVPAPVSPDEPTA
jgi:hypothetical protein